MVVNSEFIFQRAFDFEGFMFGVGGDLEVKHMEGLV